MNDEKDYLDDDDAEAEGTEGISGRHPAHKEPVGSRFFHRLPVFYHRSEPMARGVGYRAVAPVEREEGSAEPQGAGEGKNQGA